jgi:hypothetical protein
VGLFSSQIIHSRFARVEAGAAIVEGPAGCQVAQAQFRTMHGRRNSGQKQSLKVRKMVKLKNYFQNTLHNLSSCIEKGKNTDYN